jgi:hypothetical protein
MVTESIPTRNSQMEDPKQRSTYPVDQVRPWPQTEGPRTPIQSVAQSPQTPNPQASSPGSVSPPKTPRQSLSPVSDHASLYDASPIVVRQHRIHSSRSSMNQNPDDTTQPRVFGYPLRQQDLNAAVALMGFSVILALTILLLFAVAIGLVHHPN